MKHKHRHELALKERNAAEAELNAAKEQMKKITENAVEKAALVEKLTAQLSHREQNAEQAPRKKSRYNPCRAKNGGANAFKPYGATDGLDAWYFR